MFMLAECNIAIGHLTQFGKCEWFIDQKGDTGDHKQQAGTLNTFERSRVCWVHYLYSVRFPNVRNVPCPTPP